jgi:quinol monooxygenase YgiN
MIQRIVKLTFHPEKVADFMEVFEESKDKIRRVDGCWKMELFKNIDTPNVLFTQSIWDDVAALEQYRQSELFKSTWARTKIHFAAKAEAWSIELIDEDLPF